MMKAAQFKAPGCKTISLLVLAYTTACDIHA